MCTEWTALFYFNALYNLLPAGLPIRSNLAFSVLFKDRHVGAAGMKPPTLQLIDLTLLLYIYTCTCHTYIGHFLCIKHYIRHYKDVRNWCERWELFLCMYDEC